MTRVKCEQSLWQPGKNSIRRMEVNQDEQNSIMVGEAGIMLVSTLCLDKLCTPQLIHSDFCRDKPCIGFFRFPVHMRAVQTPGSECH